MIEAVELRDTMTDRTMNCIARWKPVATVTTVGGLNPTIQIVTDRSPVTSFHRQLNRQQTGSRPATSATFSPFLPAAPPLRLTRPDARPGSRQQCAKHRITNPRSESHTDPFGPDRADGSFLAANHGLRLRFIPDGPCAGPIFKSSDEMRPEFCKTVTIRSRWRANLIRIARFAHGPSKNQLQADLLPAGLLILLPCNGAGGRWAFFLCGQDKRLAENEAERTRSNFGG